VLWKCNLNLNKNDNDNDFVNMNIERKILRRIYGPIQDKGPRLLRWISEIYNLYKDLNNVDYIKIRRVGWGSYYKIGR
jgi:hypothetical protein